MKGVKGFTLIELVMIIVILGIMAVVAIPRYINMQQEAQEAAAKGYIGSLNSALTMHVADHYLKGTPWVKNGEEVMKLLEDGSEMPKGMKYSNNKWTVEGSKLKWVFRKATDTSAPRIEQVGG